VAASGQFLGGLARQAHSSLAAWRDKRTRHLALFILVGIYQGRSLGAILGARLAAVAHGRAFRSGYRIAARPREATEAQPGQGAAKVKN